MMDLKYKDKRNGKPKQEIMHIEKSGSLSG
jgi:hypothetical protein